MGTNLYECDCQPGYFGENCERFDACFSSPCVNGGLCRNVTDARADNNFRCECPQGYYGKRCELYDACVELPCLNEGECRNVSSAAFACDCQQGERRNKDHSLSPLSPSYRYFVLG